MEAINFGSKLLLIDENKSATNFMIQDRIMKILIKKEPIISFADCVNQIFIGLGVSTILVIGGSSEYLSVADNVIMMDEYVVENATIEAKSICERKFNIEGTTKDINWYFDHHEILSQGFTPYPDGGSTEKLKISDMGFIIIGDEKIDIRMLHNIISLEQLNAIGFILRKIELTSSTEHKINLSEKIDGIYEKIRKEGLDIIYSTFFLSNRWLELPRKYELIAVINRMRNIKFYDDKLLII